MINKKASIFIVVLLSICTIVLLQLNRSDQVLRQHPIKHFSSEEKRWLHDLKKPLRVGIVNIPNQVILHTNQPPTGFSIDIFHLIEKELGIKFEYVPFQSWGKLIDAAKKHQIDIVFLAQKTKERLQYLNFTDTILSQHNKIIVKAGTPNISTMEDLYKKRVAIVKNSALSEYIKQAYPQIELVPVSTQLGALKAVANDYVDATISEPVRAGKYMEKYNIRNLIIVGDVGYNYDLRIASQNDMPVLNIILSKAVNILPAEAKKALSLKWGYVKEKEYIFGKETLIYLLIAFGIVLPFAIYLYLMNQSLQEEVKKRRNAEEKLMHLNRNLEERVLEEVEKRREHELHMLEQDKLAQMGNMMKMIAHQWKQPLHNLSALIQTMIVRYRQSKLDDESVDSFHQKSENQIREMLKVMHDFMDFFKPKKDRKLPLHEIIEKTIAIVDTAFSAHNIQIIYSHNLSGDGSKFNDALGQVILNILNNAKDALIEKEIDKKEIEIKLFRDNGNHIITIEDNAGGIPDKIIKKIFDPYFSTKEEKDGTGLGLYMSKMIVENHMNGELRVTNTAKGALFTIVLR